MKDKIEGQVKTKTTYSDSFKLKLINEYLRTGDPKEQIQRRYGVYSNSAIQKWMKKLGYTDPYLKLEVKNYPQVSKPDPKSTSANELEAKIKLLERQLEDERLRVEMYTRMIDLAEEKYKISIRKNSNTK